MNIWIAVALISIGGIAIVMVAIFALRKEK